ncbi:MAG: SCO family protein [Chitinophagaceae bacterium]|nr:SCO family protein [Bacteroidota bacterium]MCC6258792.1 SCO family protein [Chitinophagaceae bacterium]
MNTKAFSALLIAILLPLTGYWILKYYSKEAVHIPPRYFYDSVRTVEGNGKISTDTVWHHVKNISFTNQLGQKVSLDDLKGKIIVLDFFFTHCPSICPSLTRNMKKLQDSFQKNDSIVQFISFSVDPERDSVPQLRKFADRFKVDHDNWWFAQADRKTLYDFAFSEIKASIADTRIDTAFIHTENFFLLDSNRVVRGWYNGLDTNRLSQLARDIPILLLEKSKTSPSFFRNYIPYLPVIFIGIGLIIFISVYLSTRKDKYDKP